MSLPPIFMKEGVQPMLTGSVEEAGRLLGLPKRHVGVVPQNWGIGQASEARTEAR